MVKAAAAKDALQVWGSGKQERVFLYAHDLAAAVLMLLDHGAQGIQYITPPDTVTVARVAELIRDLVNPDLAIEFDATKPEGRRSIAALPPHECLEKFQWTPFAEGLKRTYDGWRRKGE
jgi:nucleoside-diphosphate-sugar epimerase